MTDLDQSQLALPAIQQANADYAAANGPRSLEGRPAKKLCVLTCMDARIDPLPALGLSLGDAHVVRNGGARVSDDALRSMVLSAHALGTREFAVINHTRCGLLGAANDTLRQTVADATGTDASHIDFLPFDDLEAGVRQDVQALIDSRLLPADGVVWGATYDVDAGTLTVVVPPHARRPDVTDWRQRAVSFGTQAELYDRRRPTYPDAAVDHILNLARSSGPADTMVEIGCGTGKATTVFARQAPSLSVTAVEPDPAMADVARRHVPHAEIAVSKFEEWDAPPELLGRVDVVVSAQAWHWVDHEVAIPKVATLLRPGGVFAAMANIPREGGNDLRGVLDAVFNTHVPKSAETTRVLNWDGHIDQQELELQQSEDFDLADRWRLDWDDPLTADEFSQLMRTHSDYIAQPASVIEALAADLRTAIEDHGGTVVMRYRTIVVAAIRR